MADWANAVPWIVLLVVFVGEKLQQIFVIRSLDRALQRAQVPEATPTAAPIALPKAQPSVPRPATEKPPAFAEASAGQASQAFPGAPSWFVGALHEIGFHETGNNQGIGRYITLAHTGAEGDPWCAIFANAMLEQSGVAGTRSASSQSFRSSPNFRQLSTPALGCIAVFWRGSQASGLGHVGFYRGENGECVWTLGGNENDMVQIEALPKADPSFGLIGYWWPTSVAMPTTGPVLMPQGSPVSVKTAPDGSAPPTSIARGKQTNITATMFSGPQSAYGPAIDDSQPGVALPFRFSATRPKVRVIGKRSGVSIVCDIVDVGPWNTDDPYWQTGARPEAERGIDLGQTGRPRHTNGAGIDLTLAAAKAVQIDGKGLVDWEFVQSPADPNVV